MTANLQSDPHRRYNPLKDEWIIVSPQRLSRPWQGKVEKQSAPSGSAVADTAKSANALLPGATRPGGIVNPLYTSTHVFTNDFSALTPDAPDPPAADEDGSSLFRVSHARGTCRVMCFHPCSDLQLATMDLASIERVIREWIAQMHDLSPIYDWVQIFENKGDIMGCSNPHPHCQIWASKFLPNEPATMERTQLAYFAKTQGRPMLMDYIAKELAHRGDGRRVILENDDWVWLTPFWAMWPFETMLAPKRRHIRRLDELVESEIVSLASMLKELLVRYDNLFECSFPYSMAWHGAPTGAYLNEKCDHWLLHATWLPPLLRSASVKKFMAGYELVCEPQRDLTPEKAAQMLRAASDVHYSLAAGKA